MAIETYKGNPNLKSAQVRQEYTQEQVTEFIKCSNDPVYFIESYVNIVSIDEGIVPFKMYPFQSEIVEVIYLAPCKTRLLYNAFAQFPTFWFGSCYWYCWCQWCR